MRKNILLLFLVFSCTLNAQKIELGVIETKSEKDNWCVAASTKSVLGYKGNHKSQCNIMEYIRANSTEYGGYNCCLTINQNDPHDHPCNKGVVLGYDKEKASAVGILWNLGSFPSQALKTQVTTTFIRTSLELQCPLIAHMEYYYTFPIKQHALVICGIDGNQIQYMDPDFGDKRWDSYYDFLNNGGREWKGTLYLQTCSRDYPCHCYNLEQDPNEDGVDCGGPCPLSCPPPPPPPPPPSVSCSNCALNNGEAHIDCGGPCPPCNDVPKERIIENSNQLTTEVMATKKIIAKGSTTVASGKKVSFITEEAGSIVLLPGFNAEQGSKFSTQRKEDLSIYGRICPTKLCSTAYIRDYKYRYHPLEIYQLLYAVRIKYDIFDMQWRFIYGNDIDLSHSGTVHLWDCFTGATINQGTVVYKIFYTVYYCNKERHDYLWDFIVIDFPGSKSPNENPDDPENPTPALSPPANNTTHQDETAVPNFSVTPNPNAGTFQLETNFPLSDIDNLKITNTVGAVVYESQHLVSNEIQLQNSAPGLYFVVLALKEGTVLTQKVMVQR